MGGNIMKKAEVIESIANKAGVTKVVAANALEAVLATITEALRRGDKVPLVGFGTFEAKKRAQRMGRNPATGEPVKIPARKVVSFKAGINLKEAVN